VASREGEVPVRGEMSPRRRIALDLTKNLTIQGPGAGQLTIRGNSGHTFTRVFEVAPNTTVTLSGLSIINGAAMRRCRIRATPRGTATAAASSTSAR